jgi:hypothetical protein
MNEAAIGEVIGSSSTELTAESRQLHISPPFGSFIKVEQRQETIYAVVFNASTQSLDPNRMATAYHLPEEELRAEHPQIFELLKTQFEAVIIGYENTGVLRHHLPPQPPRLHSFVYACHLTEIRRLTAYMGFLRALMRVDRVPRDELIAATLRNAATVYGEDERGFLVQAGKELVKLVGDDYEMLTSILQRVQS